MPTVPIRAGSPWIDSAATSVPHPSDQAPRSVTEAFAPALKPSAVPLLPSSTGPKGGRVATTSDPLRSHPVRERDSDTRRTPERRRIVCALGTTSRFARSQGLFDRRCPDAATQRARRTGPAVSDGRVPGAGGGRGHHRHQRRVRPLSAAAAAHRARGSVVCRGRPARTGR